MNVVLSFSCVVARGGIGRKTIGELHMHQQHIQTSDIASSDIVLAPDDLELLEKFLEAWCAENSVDVADKSAADIASALIDWYQHALNDRNLMKAEPPKPLREAPEIDILLRQLDEA